MVRLGNGQAIIGGFSYSSGGDQAKIYFMDCSNRNCSISLLNIELSVPKGYFVAIPIPDTISGCITGGKEIFAKKSQKIYISKHLFNPSNKDCQFRTRIGDGFCQDYNNNRHCSFDGGDCCGTCVNSKYCSECECIGENSGIMNAFLDNDICEDELNHGDCMFDGLDCCGYDWNNDGDYDDWNEIVPGNTALCTECLCKGISKFEKLCTSHEKSKIVSLQFSLIDWM